MAMSQFFEGMSWKRIGIMGVSGGIFYGASDYWVDQWFANETDTKKQGRYRALSQIGVGLALGYALKTWNRDVAVGCAVGGIVGGARRLWITEGMPGRMSRWFDDNNSANGLGAGNAGAPQLGRPQPIEGAVVFTGPPRARARMAHN